MNCEPKTKNQLAYMCPIKWFTGIRGLFQVTARVFAVSTPTSKEPISPGPYAQAIASILPTETSACAIVSFRTGIITFTCSLAATSGTTPPYFLCRLTEEATTFDRICFPSLTKATPVSSHVLSIPKIVIDQKSDYYNSN